MNQDKFGQFIKDIRKKNNLTQKQLADKYNVTYQAVSKWENGKNMPDTYLIRQISKDFNVSLDELFDGEYKEENKKEKNNSKIIISLIILFLILIVLIIILITRNNDFTFKTLSSDCENFNISGNIAYNKNKSAIYITNIKYCGGNDTEEYKKIECTLYEEHNDTVKKISSYEYDDKYTKLEDFLQNVTFTVDNYENDCEDYKDNSLYLSILATTNNDKVITYKIPLKLEESCPVN